jgi:hypothetical protein
VGVDLLEQQIAEARQTIRSDGYPMSIGEISNLYRDGELYINPAFQRFYRWDEEQKSRLVESVLLGIPIPSVFVSQGEDGKWELVDGLQRISTLLELQGILRDKEGNPYKPLTLRRTKYLAALEGRQWENEDPAKSLSEAQRLDVKRSRLDIKIILRTSTARTKYDLFQRLNGYGTPLTAQEMRSALVLSVQPAFYEWVESLASSEAFVEATRLGDRDIEVKYDIELVLRFLILHNWEDVSASAFRNFSTVLDDHAVGLAEQFPANQDELARTFTETFDVLLNEGGGDVFRKWDPIKKSFSRGFLNTAFEVVALGLGYLIANGIEFRTDIIDAVKQLWTRPDMTTRFATGVSTETRLARMIPLGRELLQAKGGKDSNG